MKQKTALRAMAAAGIITACVLASLPGKARADVPVDEKIGILVTDWGTPDGYDFNYYVNIGKRSRIGEAATAEDQPCTDNFVGVWPYRSQFGVFPHIIAFNTPGYESGYDGYGIYRLTDNNTTFTNIINPAVTVANPLPQELTDQGIVADPARDITFGRGRVIFTPNPRDGIDYVEGLYIIGKPALNTATGKVQYSGYPNGIHDASELDLAYWTRVVGIMQIPDYADGPRMHPFTKQMEEDLSAYFETYFGDTVDIRFGMYEATAGLTRRHEDVALDFAAEGFKKLVLTRETTDNNNYANMFMTRSYVDLALCRGGFSDVAVEQIKQVGRTPEYNTTVLHILRQHLQRLNPGTDPVAILYTTYGNPWPGSSPNAATVNPFGVYHPWVSDVYMENAYLNYLSFKRYAEDALAGQYNLIYNRPDRAGDNRTDNYYTYGMFQPEFYTVPGETESEFKNIRENIDLAKQDGRKEIVVLLSHWYYDSIDNGLAIRDVNRLPINTKQDLENDKFWIDWCESAAVSDANAPWTEVDPTNYECSNPNDVHIVLTETFDNVSDEFILNYATIIRGGVERYGVFPDLGITIEAQADISKTTGGTAAITRGRRAGAKIEVPPDPDPNLPEGYYPTADHAIVYETINNPETDLKQGAWSDFTAYVGEQKFAAPGQPLPELAGSVGPAVFFGPYRTFFNTPARITLPYTRLRVRNPKNIRPYIYNELTKGWDQVYPAPGGQGIEVSRPARTVSFDAQVLGIFALAEPPLCPAKAVGVSGTELSTLYALRDTVLAQQARGKKYIEAYYSSAPAIVNILNEHPELKAQAAQLLTSILPACRSLVSSHRAVVDEAVVEQTVRLLDAVAGYGGPAVQKNLLGLQQDIKSLAFFRDFGVRVQKN